MTLRQVRQACKLTQEKVAKSLRIGQEGVSKLEKRSDLLISTLRDYVKAMGGQLSLVVRFPDREPVILSGIADFADSKPASHLCHDVKSRFEWIPTIALTGAQHTTEQISPVKLKKR